MRHRSNQKLSWSSLQTRFQKGLLISIPDLQLCQAIGSCFQVGFCFSYNSFRWFWGGYHLHKILLLRRKQGTYQFHYPHERRAREVFHQDIQPQDQCYQESSYRQPHPLSYSNKQQQEPRQQPSQKISFFLQIKYKIDNNLPKPILQVTQIQTLGQIIYIYRLMFGQELIFQVYNFLQVLVGNNNEFKAKNMYTDKYTDKEASKNYYNYTSYDNDSDEEQQPKYQYNDQGEEEPEYKEYNDQNEIEEKGFQQRLQIQEDIFLFKKVDLPGIPKTDKIKKFVVSEETRIVLTDTNKIYRWRIRSDAEFRPYELPDLNKDHFLGILSSKDKNITIKNIHIDPIGYHCIIVAEGGNNFYLGFKESKIKILKDLKGVTIKALSFHSSGTDTKSGDIIFSSENGVICLYRLELTGGQLIETNVLQMQIPVTYDIAAIETLRLTQSNGKNYVILIFSTLSSIYCITGLDDLELLLMNYKNQTDKIRQIPMPRGYQCLIHTCFSKLTKRPTSILWTNGTNLIHFKVPDYDENIQDSFLTKNQIFKFAKKVDLPNQKAYQMQEHPINIGITDFHYYLLFQQSITILSTITQKIVLTQQFKGSLVSDMTYEKKTGIFWIFSNKGITKLDTSKESTEAWKLLIIQKKYKEAYQVCKAKNQNVSYVAGLYADDLFVKRKYSKASVYFSETSRNFQQIFLKFLQVNHDDAREGLEIYLKSWLKKLGSEHKTQKCLLISWLIELIMYKLNNLDRERLTADEKSSIEIKRKLKEKQEDLQKILYSNLDVINEDLVYLIMQSHGRIQNLINFADRKNNFEMIVMHYLSEENYEKALDYLKNVKDDKVVEVVYKYSHIFFRYETERTVNLLIKNIRDFKPIKLMAGLMNIPDNKRTFGIELLRYCIEECRCKQRSLHNILIFFYATSPKDKIPQLIQIMKKGRLDFDLDFGLRLFKNYKIVEAQIIVYGKMYLFSEAVSLALEHNKEEMAKEYADKPQYEDEKKKLWIEIAKHYLVKKGKISEVIELTKQSKVVKIEDLLPYFNQNIKIQNFKDEICESLKSYSEEISRLKMLMDSYSSNAEALKQELRLVKNRCIEVDSSHKCEECMKTLFNQEFYIFPCMHGFHRDCLYDAVKTNPTFNRYKLQKIDVLSDEIRMIEGRIARKKNEKKLMQQKLKDQNTGFSFMNKFNIFSAAKQEEERQNIVMQKQENELRVKKEEIDSVLAAECIYCGPGVVDTITMPFENEGLKNSWKI